MLRFDPDVKEFTQYVCMYDFIVKYWEGKYTITENGEIIGIFLYNSIFDGVYHVSMIFSSKATKMQKARSGKMLDFFCDVHNAKRLETESFVSEENRKWHRYIGFDLEGTKRNVFLGNDIDIWGKL